MTDRLILRPPDLPVAEGLAEIATQEGNAVVTAPPGSGKTTLVPPLFAKILSDDDEARRAGALKVLVVQPRRVAARAAARRIASLIGEPVGEQVGFRVRGESVPGERIEMVTPGVMLRILHSEPDLPGVGAIVIDEVHERDLETDLVTAFALDVQDALRPDLRVVAMSATLAAQKVAELVGGTVVDVPGAIHPVEISERIGPQALGDFGHGITVSRDFLSHVARVVQEAANGEQGSVLVFMPGVGEIEKLRGLLAGARLPVCSLHGSLPAREQDRVLSSEEDRIIIATAVAESSLTVPGVRTVVDSGLAREARFDPRTGIGGLVTVHASRAQMTQRAGRAGREGPGRAFRCLAFARAAEFSAPEILTADMTDAALQCAAWGTPRMEGLRLLDHPQPAALESAQATLRALGAVDDAGAITELGRSLAQIPASPQLARGLIAGAREVGVETAAAIIALLNVDTRVPGADLAAALRSVSRGDRTGHANSSARQWPRERTRLEKIARATSGSDSTLDSSTMTHAHSTTQDHSSAKTFPNAEQANNGTLGDEALATVVGLAYPTWIARERGKGYLLANGAGAVLPKGSPLEGSHWLAVADLGQMQGRADAVIRAAVPIDQDRALELGADMLAERLETVVAGTKVSGRIVRSLGAIDFASEPVTLSAAQVAQARAEDIASRGIGTLSWPAAARSLRERMAFLHGAVGEPWPDVSDEALAARVKEWLEPQLGATNPDLLAGLRALLPWPEAAKLDDLAPERITTPVGTTKVVYSSGKPTVRLRIQEAFGWTSTPRLAGVPVTLELLSPAQRPLAITEDLESFWAGPYKDVRAEMRGRYPRHPWPEDPLTATPTSRAKPRKR